MSKKIFSLAEKIKSLLINLAVSIAALFFCLILCELAVRMLVPQEIMVNHHRLFCQHDPLLGWKHIPNSAAVSKHKDYEVFESFNSKGIRGPEYSYEKQRNEFRIFILGDSHAEGFTVEFHQLFSEVLKKGLNDRNKGGSRHYEVINSGVGGYSTDQELLFYEIEGKKYNSDLVILFMCDNDIPGNAMREVWRGGKPVFEIDGEKLELANVPVPETKKPREMGRSSEAMREWLYENSRLCRLMREKIRSIYFLYDLLIDLKLMEKPSERIPFYFQASKKVPDEKIRYAWQVTERLLKRLREDATSAGADLLVFFVPPQYAIYKKLWNEKKMRFGISNNIWDPDQVGIELANICRRNKIDFVDPSDIFRKRAQNKERLYFFNDGHWTASGDQLAGEILAEYIGAHYSETPKKTINN